jgi:Uma2 family endonuclease
MQASALVSEEEYLHTSYKPDCEYRNGELVERNVGTLAHSKLQWLLSMYFGRRCKRWGVHVFPEVRVRMGVGRYLIPDLAILSGAEPKGDVLTVPPLIWIEILSPEDRPLRINRKVREVLEFGVPYIWIIDPDTLESELHTPHGSTALPDGVLRLPDSPIEVPLGALEED